jgi:hypothetical protein
MNENGLALLLFIRSRSNSGKVMYARLRKEIAIFEIELPSLENKLFRLISIGIPKAKYIHFAAIVFVIPRCINTNKMLDKSNINPG